MSETSLPKPEKASAPAMRTEVTQADLDATDIETPIAGFTESNMFQMYRAYEQASVAAKEAGDVARYVTYLLFAKICSMGMDPSDPSKIWLPLVTLSDGNRFPIADDFHGELTKLLAGLVGRLQNPVLRARIADIAWWNNRKDGGSARAAIDAYCDIAIALLKGTLHDHSEIMSMQEALRVLGRAMQIANTTTKRTKRPEKIGQVFDALYAATRKPEQIAAFVRTVELGLSFGLREPRVAAEDLEAVAEEATPGPHPLPIRGALDLAANLYYNLKDTDARQRCMKAAVEQTLAMRGQVAGNFLAEAGWIIDALQRLLHVAGMEEREEELGRELRRLQRSSFKQMGSFEIDLGLGDTPEKVGEHFGKLTLSDALRQFALLDKSRDPEQLKQAVLESAKSSPLTSMLSVAHLDSEGRTQSRSAGASLDGEPPESWYRRMIDQFEGIHRAQTVRALLEPARLVIQARFAISERHFIDIINLSAFVPDSQKRIVALGVTRFFQADRISAPHLLIPQLEPCLRHVLKLAGHDPSKRRPDTTEEDLSIRSLFANFKAELEGIFGTALAFEIDHLFNLKPGPALRHEVAHGQLSTAECFSDHVYYANWLIYRLCALPVLQHWDEHVAPVLAKEE